MRIQIDLKSLVIGAVLATVVLLVLGAAEHPALRVGRFEIEVNDSHALILDSISGQVWQNPLPTTGGRPSPDFEKPKI
jgi:hypothetical protein